MKLPVVPTVAPMLAKLARELPVGEYLYEPKWDGFRAIVFRDGDEIEIQSRGEKSFNRYFPELETALAEQLPQRIVVDGEIVIATDHGLDFDLLSLRIHPAASRIDLLADEIPASFVAFDMLAEADDDLCAVGFAERRARLERALAGVRPPIHVTPVTTDPDVGATWFERFEGAGLDGVIAKPTAGTYAPGKRTLLKVKHQRTADCVVAGYRSHKESGVGSLLLGLYDAQEVLHHVGVASSFKADLRAQLAEELAPLEVDALDGHPWRGWGDADAHDAGQRMPGGPSRWNATKDLSWTPVRVERVAEVAYEHLQADRFRHTARFVRWRPDKGPAECTYAQLDAPVPAELAEVFGL